MKADARISAKRIRRLLLPMAGAVPGRTVREYVAESRGELYRKEAYVHRSQEPGQTMEVDFGESWALIQGRPRKLKLFVATLPYSNVYFARAYALERLECLLDGIQKAFEYFGGVTSRVVLDNTSLAVKRGVPGSASGDAPMLAPLLASCSAVWSGRSTRFFQAATDQAGPPLWPVQAPR